MKIRYEGLFNSSEAFTGFKWHLYEFPIFGRLLYHNFSKMVAKRVQQKVVVFAICGVAIATIAAGIVIWKTVDAVVPPFPDPSESELGVYTQAGVSSDAPGCAAIGVDILKQDGNAADAAIATLLCMGVVHSQSMGVGGGFLMTLWNSTTKTAVTLTAREKAPLAATEDMFQSNPDAAARGPLSVAVPGEFKGYWELYQRHGSGKVPWANLFNRTIELCENGFNVSRHAANAMRGQEVNIRKDPGMAEIFINNATGELYKEGDRMYRPAFAATLRTIAESEFGGDLLYMNTELMRNFVDDLRDLGGIITYQDMYNYYVNWSDPIVTDLNGFTHYTVPPPGSGIIMSFILQLMKGYDLNPSFTSDYKKMTLTYHRFVESMKHAFAKRTYLGDPDPAVGDPDLVHIVEELVRNLTSTDYINSVREKIRDDRTENDYDYYGAEFYQPEDHGTAHVSVIDKDGNAVAITSTINLHFGAVLRSRSTGIIYNDEMDDFSAPNITNSFGVPPSPNNFIRPGKRMVSSMAPSIFVDSQGRARLVIGGAGGTHITTSTAYAAMRNLMLGQTIKEAIDIPRLHHQLYGMSLLYEEGFPQEFVRQFEQRLHKASRISPGSSIVVGVSRGEDGTIYANSDFRKGGDVCGLPCENCACTEPKNP